MTETIKLRNELKEEQKKRFELEKEIERLKSLPPIEKIVEVETKSKGKKWHS